MKRKKLTAGILIISMMLTACSSFKLPQNASDATDEKEEQSTEQQTEMEETNLEIVTEKINSAPPMAELEYMELKTASAFDKLSGSFCRVKIQSEEYSNLKAKVDEYFDAYYEKREKQIEEMIAKIDVDERENVYYACDNTVDIKCADANIFSILMKSYEYKNTYGDDGVDTENLGLEYIAVSFDSRTGEMIQYKDLGDISGNLIENLSEIHDFVEEDTFTADVDDYMRSKVTDQECLVPFYIDERGINLVFAAEDISTEITQIYNARPYIVNVTYEEMPDFNDHYKTVSADYRINIMDGLQDNLVDLDGDGKKEKISFTCTYDEYDWPEDPVIHIGDKDYPCDNDWEGYNAVYYNMDGKNYIDVINLASNDYKGTTLYAVDDGLHEILDCSGDIVSFTKDGISVETSIYILGTWGVTKDYVFDDSGKLVEKDGLFYVLSGYSPDEVDEDSMQWRSIKATQDFTDRNGKTITAGTRLYPVCSDGDLFIILQDKEHNQYELELTHPEDNSWGLLINGIDEYELFESLPYAG